MTSKTRQGPTGYRLNVYLQAEVVVEEVPLRGVVVIL